MSIKSHLLKSRLVRNMINSRIAFRQYRNNKEIVTRLQELKDSHKGERCFIIGTGPSLTIQDLEMLQGEVTFGTNRIYELFPRTVWRPTYYVNQDHELIKKYGDSIRTIDAERIFLPVDYAQQFPGKKYSFFVLKYKEFFPHDAPFSTDISRYLAQGFTVTYGAIQIAAYMGFTEMYLLGIDHNYNIFRDAHGQLIKSNSIRRNYPEGINELKNQKNLPRVEETTVAYETAEKLSRKLGFRVYNSTRGGRLEAFERANLDMVIGG